VKLIDAIGRFCRRHQDVIVPILSISLAIAAYGITQQSDEAARVRATHEARR
jgi:hypothetical protein